MSAVPRRSNRFRSRPTKKKPKTIETTLNAPNHTTGSKFPIDGKTDVADEVRLLQPVERLARRCRR